MPWIIYQLDEDDRPEEVLRYKDSELIKATTVLMENSHQYWLEYESDITQGFIGRVLDFVEQHNSVTPLDIILRLPQGEKCWTVEVLDALDILEKEGRVRTEDDGTVLSRTYWKV